MLELELAKNHIALVSHVASQVSARLPQTVDIDDLAGPGHLGLLKAIRTFDPGKNVHFSTWAARCIRFAMLDYLRDNDWAPRLERRRQKKTGERPVTIHSLDRAVFQTGGGRDIRQVDLLPDSSLAAPESRLSRRLTIDQLCRGMNRSERLAVVLYFFEGLTMRETGRAIGVCEARVSQMIKLLTRRLRSRFTEPQCRALLGLEVAA